MEKSANIAIEASGVSKVYLDGSRRLEIFRDVSLSIKKGEGVVILGPSGSGKTTLLNILSGLDAPSEGRVAVSGQELGAMSENERSYFRNKKIGFVFQFYYLLNEFTALENVMLPALASPDAKDREALRKKALALLAQVGLEDRAGHFPGEISGGEQQRVAIARALINDPEMIFCDEPTGNLDRQMGLEIAGLLGKFFKEVKKTVVMVTHDERIAATADRVWSLTDREWRTNVK
jgi:ABC-type lipoprotein export system ATPase subunit